MPAVTTCHGATPPLSRAHVALFATASALSVANVYYAQPLLDLLSADFAIGHGAIGAVIAATQAGSALALVLLVPLGDVLNRRRLMLAQLGALVAALMLVACAGNAATLLAAMLAVGLLGTAMTQGLIAYAAAAAPPSERGAVVGAAQGGVVIGLLLARVLAGAIADVAGWRAVYGASALAMLALGLLLWQALPALALTVRPLAYGALLRSMASLLRHDRVLHTRGMLALLMFAAFGIFWSALVFPLSASPYHYGHTAIGAFGLVGMIGALAAARAGRWADRGHGQRVTGAALAVLVLAWLPLAFAPVSLAALIAGIVLLDLAVQALQVINQSMLFAAHPHAHSRVVACYMLFYAVGSGAGALGATAMYAVGGWGAVCGLGAGVSVAAVGVWVMTWRGGDEAVGQ